ncbi:MAG: ABC transporter ATP-binding protein [Ruminococcus sp.]|nr:ABC transporter ATP-binding protein [Ruminococcus sp.]
MINMTNIIKRYYIGQPNELQILNGIDLRVDEGEFVAIVGQSGSGKSTLMNIIGALDRPTEGEYFFNNRDISKMSDKELSKIRNKEIGFVFQNFNLIPRATALKNVELPMVYAKVGRKERTQRAKELLEMVDMSSRYNHNPNELSGGQKQRVAIARAMANNPNLILADEPTGALDTKTGRTVMDIFHKLHSEGKTIVLITHSPELAEETERIITISDGNIISDVVKK